MVQLAGEAAKRHEGVMGYSANSGAGSVAVEDLVVLYSSADNEV